MAYAVNSLLETIEKILNDDRFPISVNGKQKIESIQKNATSLEKYLKIFPREAYGVERRIGKAAYEFIIMDMEYFLARATDAEIETTYVFQELERVEKEISSIAKEVVGFDEDSPTNPSLILALLGFGGYSGFDLEFPAVFRSSSTKFSSAGVDEDLMREDGRSSTRHIPKPRHLAINCSRAEFIQSINQNGFFHGGGNFDPTPPNWESFQFLDLEGFGLEEFPEAITGLKRLKYLGLRDNYIRELPESLERLEELRVLDISLNFAVVVPDILWKMKNLHHIIMSDILCRDGGLKIDGLVNLRTLAYIPLDSWKYEQSSLQMMNNLGKLGIEELSQESDVRNLFASLARFPNLVRLNLRGSRFNSMPSLNDVGYLSNLTELKIDGRVAALPEAENFPPKLCYLKLANTCVEEDPMPVLERLSKLLYLKLRNAYSGERMVITREGFPKLQKLRIGEFWHLRELSVEAGAMTQLQSVVIHGCPNWENPPSDATIIH